MKTIIFKWLCVFAIVLSAGEPRNTMAQTNYSVPVTLSISNTAINRVIGTQWASIQDSWSGYFYYGPYTISLYQPVIILADNAIRIRMTLNVSSYIYNGSFTMTPTLTIPPTTISMSNIVTAYQDLQQQINNYISDQYLRALIYQLLSPITWYVYQGQILNNSTTRLTQTAYIALKGLPSLTFTVQNNAVNIIVTPTFVAAGPSYSFYWMRPSRNQFQLKVTSNDQFVIENLDIYATTGGGPMAKLSLSQPAQTTATWNSTDGLYEATYIVNSRSSLSEVLYTPTYSIKLMRQYSETLWCELCAPYYGFGGTSWLSFYAQSNDGTTIGE